MRRKRWWLGGALALAAIGLVGRHWLGERDPRAPLAVASMVSAVGSVDAEASVPKPVVDTSIEANATAPVASDVESLLPAPDAPLDAVIVELLPRAEAGEARAACRLGFELLRCQAILSHGDRLAEALRRHESNLASMRLFTGADELAVDQIRVLEFRERCSAVSPSLISQAAQLLYQSALAGNREAQIRFINADWAGFGSGFEAELEVPAVEFLSHPLFPVWQREAPRMAKAMIERGDPFGLLALGLGYHGSLDLFSALIPDDPVESLVLLQTWQRINGRPERPMDNLDAQQQREVRRRADALYQSKFLRARDERDFFNQMMPPGLSLEDRYSARCD